MKKTQYSNTPPLHHSSLPDHNRFWRTNGRGPCCPGLAPSHGVPCGGWCPKGRKAEDGPIDAKYPLKETPSESYIQRTEWNVRDSDATILFSIEPTLTGGSLRTMEFARKHGKPHVHLCAGKDTSAEKLRAFFEHHDVKVLNVAGPRASTEPRVGQFVMALLDEVFGVPD